MGFTLSDVRVAAGEESVLWYKNRWEANYVVVGTLGVTDVAGERSWELGPGALYCAGPNDRHHVLAKTDIHIVSVFNPPLVGDETHDDDGAYPPTGELPPGAERMFVRTVEELRSAGREKTVAAAAHSPCACC